jgi:hypothetical protein
MIDMRYPSQLDAGLNTALQSLRAASGSESKRARRKRRNSATKKGEAAENGETMEEAVPVKPTQVEDQVLKFISLTFRVREAFRYALQVCYPN